MSSGRLEYFFPAVAARRAGHSAVTGAGISMTWEELLVQSGRIASTLRSAGAGRTDRVAIWARKSPRAVAAMLGVLRAGTAYVPLDPRAPAQRVTRVLQSCAPAALIADPDLPTAELLDAAAGAGTRLLVTTHTAGACNAAGAGLRQIAWGDLDPAAAEGQGDGFTSDDLAFILHTSGSTGMPKGIMITHRNARTFVDWCIDEFEVTAEDRILNIAPLHFDLSVFDIYAGLGAGATVVLPSDGMALFPQSLAEMFGNERISIVYAVPSAIVRLLGVSSFVAERLPRLRLILYAGEPFPMNSLRELRQRFPAVRIVNLYGPAETNVCTYHEIPKEIPPDAIEVPIGRACPSFELAARRADGSSIASGEPGEAGELWVRGPGVSPGYWRAPELTRDKFIADPRDPDGTGPWYRTGDRVVLDGDGRFLFRGRIDAQIKRRGYRIEPGEIEATLQAHPEVREAAVVACGSGDDCRIMAFVLVTGGLEPPAGQLLEHCRRFLPPSMVPDELRVVDELPRTSTGKIHRVALVESVLKSEVPSNE